MAQNAGLFLFFNETVWIILGFPHFRQIPVCLVVCLSFSNEIPEANVCTVQSLLFFWTLSLVTTTRHTSLTRPLEPVWKLTALVWTWGWLPGSMKAFFQKSEGSKPIEKHCVVVASGQSVVGCLKQSWAQPHNLPGCSLLLLFTSNLHNICCTVTIYYLVIISNGLRYIIRMTGILRIESKVFCPQL